MDYTYYNPVDIYYALRPEFLAPHLSGGSETITVDKRKCLKELQIIPGVGPRVAEDLYDLGYYTPESLQGEDPALMYERLCAQQGCKVDRCMLYVFRCAVYFVSNKQTDPELLKWWNWKDQ